MDATSTKRRLSVLVNDLTTTGSLQLDEANLRDLKSLCKNQDANVRLVFELLFAQFSKNHAQIRYSALQVADELFQRSRVFRDLLVDQFDLFLEKTVGIKDKQLPLPRHVAEKLQRLAIEVVERWFTTFGKNSVKLSLGYEYLEKCETNPTGGPPIFKILKDVLFMKEKERENQEKAQRKYEKVLEQVGDCEEDLRDILTKMDTSFRLLLPDPRSQGLSFYLESSLGNETKVKENEDNSVVLETIRECQGLLDKKYDKLLDIWIQVLSHGKHVPTDRKADEELLKRLTHLKTLSQTLLARCDTLGLSNASPQGETEGAGGFPSGSGKKEVQESDEEDDFEDVVEETTFDDVPDGFINDDDEEPQPPESNLPSTSSAIERRELTREELLSQAPVLPYGPDLESWGKKDAWNVTTNSDLIESFWYRTKDFDTAPDPLQDITRKRRVALPTPSKSQNIKACRAPLKNGKFCERQDLESCPFHGPIINRNEKGNPVDEAGAVIPNYYPERTFQRKRKELWEEPPAAKKGRKAQKVKKLFNEDLLNQWKNWEDDNRLPVETIMVGRPEKPKEEPKGPGLEVLHKKPVGHSRVRSIINSRAARKETSQALDRQAEIARRDLLENQWRPF